MERWKILHSAKDLKQKRRDSERVVRTFRETHAISAIVNSTTQNVSIIYQLLFINKKHNIPYKVYCVFHILRNNPKVLRNGFMYKHCIFAQILILKTSNLSISKTLLNAIQGGTMAIKLIAIDIDGTLINSKREITPRVKAALNAASAQGVYVVLCTGRPYPGVEGLLQELDLVNDHDYVVTYNGTLVQQTGSKKALVRFSMTHDDLERVNDYATKYNVHYHAIDEEAIYVPTETVGKYSIHESELVGMPIVHQLYKDIPTDKEFVKIMFVDEPEVLENLIEHLSEDFKSRYNIFRSAGFYLEVIHPEASKGKAVHHLADKLGLTRDEVMCLGDHENDRDMIEYAGLGVAMGNAIDSIKEIANFVTTTNDEDGVAVAVEKFVLNKEN